MTGWLALLLVVALLVALAVGARRTWVAQRAAERDEAWRTVAAELHHAYSTADAARELDALPLPLLGRIDTEVVAPELTGPSEGGRQRLFTASIDGRPTTIGVADLARPVPSCSLRPSGADGPHVGAGWDDVDLDLAHIRARFEVRGEDADHISAFLEGDLGGWLAGEGTDWAIEMAGHQVLLARDEIPVERFGEVVGALDAFRARLPWAPEETGDEESTASGGDGGTGDRRRGGRRRRRGKGGSGDGG